MRKLFFVVLFLGIIISVCSAGECKKTTVVNNTTVENTYINETETPEFDYGAYLDLVVLETENTEWGFRATHLTENSETRVYAGATIYLNRIVSKK